MKKLTVKEILELNESELEKLMTSEEVERMTSLNINITSFLEMLQESAKLGEQAENEVHTSISQYLDYLEEIRS